MRRAAPKSVDEYLENVSEPARSTLLKVRDAIRSAAPADATETISYHVPTFKWNGPLVAYAAFSKHCSFFPMSYATIRKYHKELTPYLASKGTVRFALDQPLPGPLVKKLVKSRVAENKARRKS
jgi:uncharacterized protein YdhG (YjbR/CyaY superfamily)